MSGQQFEEGGATRCVGCGAQFIAGEPMHCLRVATYNADGSNEQVRLEHRCRECSELLAWALWPEDYGPCPHIPMRTPSRRLS